jgi:hypothetical protein
MSKRAADQLRAAYQPRRAVRNHPPLDVAEFNARFQIGSKFIYYSVILPPRQGEKDGRGDGIGRNVVTRSEAWALGDGEAVVMIEGQAGGVSLRALEIPFEPLPAEPAEPCCNAARACAGIPETQLLGLSRAGNAHARLIQLSFYADFAAAEREPRKPGELTAGLVCLDAAVNQVAETFLFRAPDAKERAEMERLIARLRDVLAGPVPERYEAGEFTEAKP